MIGLQLMYIVSQNFMCLRLRCSLTQTFCLALYGQSGHLNCGSLLHSQRRWRLRCFLWKYLLPQLKQGKVGRKNSVNTNIIRQVPNKSHELLRKQCQICVELLSGYKLLQQRFALNMILFLKVLITFIQLYFYPNINL